MKFLAVLLTSSLFLLSSVKTSLALYDPRSLPNNKVGVHILSPDEIESAARLVNSQGGDWGYVTIPIQPTERDPLKWQAFMHQARELHLIPIIRITTIPQGGTWDRGDDTDLVDFANFLGELDWPIENRYIVLFNEVNRSNEWGGTVDPAKYSEIVKNARTIFKERSTDFFLLGPSLDSALANTSSSMSSPSYLRAMATADPLIWSYFDGWASHSYPNPGYIASPSQTGLQSVSGYKSELSLLGLSPKPIFITETGWDQNRLSGLTLTSYWSKAWKLWNSDPQVVAVTPFVLHGGEQFSSLSLLDESNQYRASGQALFALPKTIGQPTAAHVRSPSTLPRQSNPNPVDSSFFKAGPALLKLENIFRVILGLPVKAYLHLKDLPLTVELAQTPKQWETGLSHRQTLGEIGGMLFIFPREHIPLFWMKDMAFPIDMIWVASGKVVDITSRAPVETGDKLPTYSPSVPVTMVLETRAGWALENNITVGDQLTLD